MAISIYALLFGFLIPFSCFLFTGKWNDRNTHAKMIDPSSVKTNLNLQKVEIESYHKRKISPEAAKIYNEQLAFYKKNTEKDCMAELTARWFEESIDNCDMQKATRFCNDLWKNHDAKLFLNIYIMTRLFKIHDYYE